MTIFLSEYCQTGLHNMCHSCECSCHTRLEMDPSYTPEHYAFTIDELKALYSVLEREYIPHENEAAHAAINKIMRIIREHGLVAGPSKSA